MTKRDSIKLFKELSISAGFREAKKKMTDEQKTRIGETQFRNRIIARIRDNMKVKDKLDLTDEQILASASEREVKKYIRKEINSESFTSAAERSRTNLVNSLKEDFPEQYKELKTKLGQGKFGSIKSSLVWNQQFGGYVMDGRYLIDVSNSPKTVNIVEL